jgi:hypothetical protein
LPTGFSAVDLSVPRGAINLQETPCDMLRILVGVIDLLNVLFFEATHNVVPGNRQKSAPDNNIPRLFVLIHNVCH